MINIGKIGFGLFLCAMLFNINGCTFSSIKESNNEQLFIAQNIKQGYFNEVLLNLKNVVSESFKQNLQITQINYGKWTPLVAHRLYSQDDEMVVEFRVLLYSDASEKINFRYLVKGEDGKYKTDMEKRKAIQLKPENYQVEIRYKDGGAQYIINGDLMYDIPLLHDVTRIGVLYSGVHLEMQIQTEN